MSARSGRIDERAARRAFERAGRHSEAASRLEAEVGARLRERLGYIKVEPKRILDAGSGPGREARALAARYRGAQVLALDYALPMLPRRRLFQFKRPLAVCADLTRLPFGPESVGLAWCNMALHWLNDPLAAFREFDRVLAPGGLFIFSTLGPDTLKELRAAAGAARVHEFADMHDLGDMLVAAGLTNPVMEMELITMDYKASGPLIADLRASGQTNARADRRRGLSARAFGDRLRSALDASPRMTYEVVYGHAWKRPARDTDVKTVRVFKRIP